MNNNEMKDNETFKVTYSAKMREEIDSIRKKYVPKEEEKMERLRMLDAKAGKKATAVSVAVGTVGALIMGIGMSLIMSDFGEFLGSLALPIGIPVGVIGIVTIALAYPIYDRTLKKERQKNAPEIIRLSDELLK